MTDLTSQSSANDNQSESSERRGEGKVAHKLPTCQHRYSGHILRMSQIQFVVRSSVPDLGVQRCSIHLPPSHHCQKAAVSVISCDMVGALATHHNVLVKIAAWLLKYRSGLQLPASHLAIGVPQDDGSGVSASISAGIDPRGKNHTANPSLSINPA